MDYRCMLDLIISLIRINEIIVKYRDVLKI